MQGVARMGQAARIGNGVKNAQLVPIHWRDFLFLTMCPVTHGNLVNLPYSSMKNSARQPNIA
jgi:hypothetical protein